jgi:Holliday junction resolvase RusA-like endonuclease
VTIRFAYESMTFEPGRWIALPAPPSANRYVRSGRGHLYSPKEVTDYEKSVRAYLTAIRAVPIRTTPVRVEFIWYRARRSGDLDNRLKAALDSCAGHLFEDDRQVAQITAMRIDGDERPRVEIRVTPWTAITERAA